MKILIIAADPPAISTEIRAKLLAEHGSIEIITPEEASKRGMEELAEFKTKEVEQHLNILKAADNIYLPSEDNPGPIGAITPKRRGKRNYR